MKKLITVLLLTSFLFGCTTLKKNYVRDTSPGKIIEITVDEWETMIENENTFLVSFSQLYCQACNDMHQMLNSYLTNHHVVFYEVILDDEEGSPFEIQDRINEHVGNFQSTPGVYFFKDGKKKDQFSPSYQIDEEQFDQFIIKNQIDYKE